MTGPKVTFYSIRDNRDKIRLVSDKSIHAYRDAKRLLISVPNLQSAHYIDTLLWSTPPDSFLPHIVSDMPTTEWIAITLQNEINVNESPRVLNLSPRPCFLPVEEIYEIFDESHPDKTLLSENKIRLYKEQGYPLDFTRFIVD